MSETKKHRIRIAAGVGGGLAAGVLAIGAIVGLSVPANAADNGPGDAYSATTGATGLPADAASPNGPDTIAVQRGEDGSIAFTISTPDPVSSSQTGSTGLAHSAPGLPENTAVHGDAENGASGTAAPTAG